VHPDLFITIVFVGFVALLAAAGFVVALREQRRDRANTAIERSHGGRGA
jgi:hypothetical protein